MSAAIVKAAVSAIAKGPKTSKSLFGVGVTAGFGGLTMWSEYHATGKEYGQGMAALKAAVYMAPTGLLGGLAIGAAELGYHALNANTKYQKGRTKSSFTQGFSDPFGNAATMRQRSQMTLQRGRASLGSEARLFH